MRDRSNDWLAETYGRATDAVGNAIGDVRNKLVFEGWFGRKTAEPRQQNDLGWSHDHPSVSDRADQSQSLAERLGWDLPDGKSQFHTHQQEQDRGLDR